MHVLRWYVGSPTSAHLGEVLTQSEVSAVEALAGAHGVKEVREGVGEAVLQELLVLRRAAGGSTPGPSRRAAPRIPLIAREPRRSGRWARRLRQVLAADQHVTRAAVRRHRTSRVSGWVRAVRRSHFPAASRVASGGSAPRRGACSGHRDTMTRGPRRGTPPRRTGEPSCRTCSDPRAGSAAVVRGSRGRRGLLRQTSRPLLLAGERAIDETTTTRRIRTRSGLPGRRRMTVVSSARGPRGAPHLDPPGGPHARRVPSSAPDAGVVTRLPARQPQRTPSASGSAATSAISRHRTPARTRPSRRSSIACSPAGRCSRGPSRAGAAL